jgi:magnesium-protoporphyrin IX monomethyl ester (oxidative) cyclase
MKTDPKLTAGINVFWIKFFLTAVYSTMYIRDHQRPAFHKALGVDPDWYAEEVFTKTSELTKQIFPITLDIDNPKWFEKVKRLQKVNVQLAEAKKNKNRFKQLWFSSRAAFIFLSLLAIPAKSNKVPNITSMEPAY